MSRLIFPSARESWMVIGLTALFLLLTGLCIGLRGEHWLMAGLFVALFFAGKSSRKLAVALLPFIIFAISYDWMRVYPNYEVNPIDVKGLYEAEKSLFGISSAGMLLTPCEYFAQHHCALADFLPDCSTCAGCLFPLRLASICILAGSVSCICVLPWYSCLSIL